MRSSQEFAKFKEMNFSKVAPMCCSMINTPRSLKWIFRVVKKTWQNTMNPYLILWQWCGMSFVSHESLTEGKKHIDWRIYLCSLFAESRWLYTQHTWIMAFTCILLRVFHSYINSTCLTLYSYADYINSELTCRAP